MSSEAAAAEIFLSMSEKRRHEAAMGLDDHRDRAERIIQSHYDAATTELRAEVEAVLVDIENLLMSDPYDHPLVKEIVEPLRKIVNRGN